MRLLFAAGFFAATLVPTRASGAVWATLPSLPYSRSDMSNVAINGLIYILGGCDGDQHCTSGFCSCTSYTNDMTIFNPATGLYVDGPPMPSPRYRHDACGWRDSIYVFGGRTLPADNIITTIDAFNATTGVWSTLAVPYPPDLGSDNSCATLNDTIYVMGGYTPDYSVSLNSTYAFAPATGTWTRKGGAMKAGRGDFSSAVLQGTVHAYGGYQATADLNDFCAPIRVHEAYNPATDSWALLGALPDDVAEKDDGVVLSVGGQLKIVSIGGEKKSMTVNCNDTDLIGVTDVLSYDPLSNAWTFETALPTPRMRFASAVVNNTAYSFGGQGPYVPGGSFIPLVYTAVSLSFPPNSTSSPSPSAAAAGSSSAPTFSAGSIAGAVLGTFFATVAVAIAIFAHYRNRATVQREEISRLQREGKQIQV